MINIKVIGTPLYQWESGRKIQITPLPNMHVDAVHFSNFGDTEALVVKPREENGNIIADIPNILLQSGRNIVVYTVNVAEDSVETLVDCTISVRSRAKPADYVYTETEIFKYEDLEKKANATAEKVNNLEKGLENTKQLTSQGRSAKYNFTTPGWKRILNIIRATNGAIDIGLASGNPYRMVQALAFDITGFVKYPTDTSDSKPTVIKRYENTFGQDNAVESHPFRITKIRVGYPKKGTTFPNTDGTTDYTVNPVNCYVDIYVDFAAKDHKSIAFNMNYAGFADSHKCAPITEETNATDTGIYGEELTYYTVDVDSMPYFAQNTEVLKRNEVYSGSAAGYGIRMHSNGFLSIDTATNGEIDKGTNKYKPISAANVRYAVEKVLQEHGLI